MSTLRDKRYKWTEAATQTARQMLRDNAPASDFLQVFGATRKAAMARIRHVDNFRSRKNRDKGEYTPRVLEVPQCVVVDALQRSNAARTLTGFVFGDPPVGFSALDKRGAANGSV